MDFDKVLESRYSVRSFSDKPVEIEKIDKILQAGRIAPTACNNQPQKIYVLNSEEKLDLWKKCTVCHYNEQLVILICYDKDLAWKRSYDSQSSGYVDASIVTTYMMLAAENLGIGSTWIMHFIPESVREEFSLPDNLEPVSALVMGYPAADATPSPKHLQRKDLSETAIW